MKTESAELKEQRDKFKKELSNLLDIYSATIIAEGANIFVEFGEIKSGSEITQINDKINLGNYFN